MKKVNFMEHIKCKICESDEWKDVFSGKDNLHDLPGTFTVAKCQRCGFMATNPRPSASEIGAYYPESYKPYQLNIASVKHHAYLRREYPRIYGFIDPLHTLIYEKHTHMPASVLEIGCGSGSFLHELKIRFPHWNIQGTDLSEKSIRVIQNTGINSFVSDLTELPIASKSVDAIYGWMIVEHIHNLEKALSEVHRVLTDEGIFVFSIPNAAGWQFKVFGKNLYSLHLPAHLYHFSENTIKKLMNKNNFKVDRIIYQRTCADVILSLGNIVKNSHLPQWLKRLLASILLWRSVYHIITLPLAYVQAFLKQSGRITLIVSKYEYQK